MCKGILKNYTPPVPSLPSDFFEAPMSTTSEIGDTEQKNEEKMEEESECLDDTNLDRGELPKGFFDDPMLDAKVSVFL